jgi:ParB family chromosome partitioning protein
MQDSSPFQFLAIDTIHESTTNPRRTFDEAKLYELAESIKHNGLIQPITVRPNSQGFEIVAGARRYRAAQLAELFSVPARIVEIDDAKALEWQLVELSIVVKRFLSFVAVLHVVDMSTTCRFSPQEKVSSGSVVRRFHTRRTRGISPLLGWLA